MGFLDALFSTAVPMLGGRAAGQNQGFLLQRQLQQEDADRQQKQQEDTMRMALLQRKLDQPEAPPEWHPGSYEEAIKFAQAGRAPPQPHNMDPNSQEARDIEFNQHRRIHAYDVAHPTPDKADKPFNPNDPRAKQKYLMAYMQQTARAGTDPKTGLPIPTAPPRARLAEGEAAWDQMVRLTSPGYDPSQEPAWHPPMALNTDPGAMPQSGPVASPQASPAPPPEMGASVPASGQPTVPIGARIQALKAAGKSKDEARQILSAEGYLDQQGNVLGAGP